MNKKGLIWIGIMILLVSIVFADTCSCINDSCNETYIAEIDANGDVIYTNLTNDDFFIPTQFAEVESGWEEFNNNQFNPSEVIYIITLVAGTAGLIIITNKYG